MFLCCCGFSWRSLQKSSIAQVRLVLPAIARHCTRTAAWMSILMLAAFCAPAQTANFNGVKTVTVGGFEFPASVVRNAEGDVFVADPEAGVVKEIHATNGQIASNSSVVVVGSGFSEPYALALDSSGDVIVADLTANKIKMIVASNGQVSSSSSVITIANGTNFNDPYALAMDTAGNLYVADFGDGLIYKITANAGLLSGSSPAIAVGGSNFDAPSGVAVDAEGDVFVSNFGNGKISKIVASSGSVSGSSPVQVVSTTADGFTNPVGMTFDASGDLFVADDFNNWVRELIAVNGEITTASKAITVGGPFQAPRDVAIGPLGTIIVADGSDGVVSVEDPDDADFGSVNVGSTSSEILIPFTFDQAGSITGWTFLTNGAASTEFAQGGINNTCSKTSYSALYTCTLAAVFKPQFPGLREGTLQLLSGSTVIATARLSGIGTAPQSIFPSDAAATAPISNLSSPSAIVLDGSENLYVADTGNNAVKQIKAISGQITSSSVVTSLGTTDAFKSPRGVALDGNGNVYIADTGNNAVEEIVSTNGTLSTTVTQIQSGFDTPQAVAVDKSGNVFVASSGDSTVKEIVAMNGQAGSDSQVVTIGSGFNSPQALAIDGSGDVFVADAGNNKVYEVVAVNGALSSTSTVNEVGSGFSAPAALAVDAAGDVFVADAGDNAIKEIVAVGGVVSSTSTVTPLASAYTEANGFASPQGIALDAEGDLFFSNDGNNSISAIPMAFPPTIAFASTNEGSTSSDSPQVITVANDGNTTLIFPLPTAAGAENPSLATEFTYSNLSTCLQTDSSSSTAFTLAAGASCSAEVDFSPTAAGSITGTLVLTDNSLNAASPKYTTQTVNLSGTSISLVNHFVFTTAPPATVTSGVAFNVTVTAYSSTDNSQIAADYSGPITFTSTDVKFTTLTGEVLTNGVGTFSITLFTVGNQKLTVADGGGEPSLTSGNINVTAGPPAMISIVSGDSQTIKGVEFAPKGLEVLVTDISGNPVSGATVTFTAPTSGASATPYYYFAQGASTFTIAPECVTDSVGECTNYIVSNGIAGAYQITATLGSASVQFSLTNQAADLYIVTVLTDPATGTASNCTIQSGSNPTPDANCSLRDAVAAAASGDKIQFKSGLNGTINVNNEYDLNGALTIQGPGAQYITISGGNKYRLFSTFYYASFSGMTFANGFGTSNCVSSSNGCSSGFPYPGGGAIASYGGLLNVDRSSFLNNSADVADLSNLPYGGALFGMFTSMNVTNSYFQGNVSVFGGAIEANQSSPLLAYNDTFVGNSAPGPSQNGGAIGIIDSTLAGTIVNCTFIDNTTPGVNGVGGAISATNSIIANNVFVGSTPGAAISSVSLVNVAPNIDANNVYYDDYLTQYDLTDKNCDGNCQTTNAVQASANPLLPVGQYGGATLTAIPFKGSPAICAGAASYVPAAMTTDQRGYPINKACIDAGAVQTNYLTVTTNQDTTDATPDCESGTGNTCSLRDAISIASQADIDFASTLNGQTITLTSPLAITTAPQIIGPGANQLTIDGGGAVGPLFSLSSAAQATISGLALAHGSSATSGGAVSNGGSLLLLQDWIHDNTAAQNGGGVYTAPNTSLQVLQSTISGNTSTNGAGGGIALDANTTTKITSSTIAGNNAAGASSANGGGGVALTDSSATLTLQNTTISNNSANGSDGGVTGPSATVNVTNSLIEGNTGGSNGQPDIAADLTVNGSGNVINTGTTTVNPQLAPLGSWGGTLETMPVLPSSPAFCAGAQGNLEGITSDQRGFAITSSDGSAGTCTDSGATNANFALSWITQPSGNYAAGAPISPAPAVAVQDHGITIPVSGTVTLQNGYELAGTLSVAAVNGVATFTNLLPSVTTALELTANYPTILPSYTLTASTAEFTTSSPLVGFAITGIPSTTQAGQPITFTITALQQLSPPVTYTGYTGVVNFSVSSLATLNPTNYSFASADQGVHTFTNGVTFLGAGNTTFTAFVGTAQSQIPVKVTPGPLSQLKVISGAGQSAGVGLPFGAVEIVAEDAGGNGLNNQNITITPPTSGASATLVPPTCTTWGYGTCSVVPIANQTAGSYQLTASSGSLSTNFTLTNTLPHEFVVEVATDTTSGVASNCPDMSTSSTPGPNCSLRDALAAASGVSSSVVQFAFTSPTTITLGSEGTLTLPNGVSIEGATMGKGANLANLVTVAGGGLSSNFPVFTATSVNARVNNLIIENGRSTTNAGGIVTTGGNLTIYQSSILNNSGGNNGGGIYNTGTVTIVQSFISGNTSAEYGGGIYNASGATVNLFNSTVTGNSAQYGGGVYSADIAEIWNDTFTANTATKTGGGFYNAGSSGVYNSIFTNDGTECIGKYSCTLGATDVNDPTGANAMLSPQGSYGGPTPSYLPLPGSPAICLASDTYLPPAGNSSSDQRGFPNSTTYATPSGPTTCFDSGAVQTNYGLEFTSNPPAAATPGVAFNPAPEVQLLESGSAVNLGGDAVQLSAASGSLTGTTTANTNSTGIAAFNGVASAGSALNDTLIATDTVSASGFTPVLAVTASSQPFTATSPIDHFTLTGYPSSITAGTSFTVQVTAYSDATDIATNYTGPITFQSTDSSAVFPAAPIMLTAGQGTFAITLLTAGSQTLTVADASGAPSATSNAVIVSAAAASQVQASSGNNQSAVIGAQFTNPLNIEVTDAYRNPIGGVLITFTAPATGASAVLSASTCTTSTTTTAGYCSVTATANGTASAIPYSVTASVAGIATPAQFTLTNNQASTNLTVTPQQTNLSYGQPATIIAAISPVTAGGTAPTGQVTFYDGATALSPNVAVASSAASETVVVPAVGTHKFGAQYLGDTNFLASGEVSASSAVAVNKANSTINGPATPVSIPSGQAGSIALTVTGQFSGALIATPSGFVSYSVSGNVFPSGSATITGGSAIISVPSTLAPGPYTLTVNYAGDGNYNAANTANISFQIGQQTPAVNIVAPSGPIVYGAPLGALLNASVTVAGNSVADLGTLLWMAAPSGGSAQPVSSSTVLAAGTYTLLATWTPLAANSGAYNAASSTNVVKLTVNPAILTVTANSPTITYGQTLPVYGYTISGFVNGDTQQTTVTGYPSLSTSPAAPTAAGTYTISETQNTLSAANYLFSITPGTLTINKAVLTVTANNATITYGQALPAYTATMSGFVNGDTAAVVSGLPSFTTTPAVPSNAGTYPITPSLNTLTSGNYTFNLQPGILTISQSSQTINFTLPSTENYATTLSLPLTATASSQLPITYAVVSGPATISGNTLTISGTGAVTVSADQGGNTNYSAATQVTQTVMVNAAPQTINFVLPSSATYTPSLTVPLSASASSGLSVSYSVTGPATVSSNTLTITGAGTVVVTATQAGNSLYTAATPVSQSIIVGKALQTINFTAPPSVVLYGTAPLSLSATATSGLGVTFQVDSGPGTINGTVLTISGAGKIVVEADQAGDPNNSAAAPVTATIVVNPALLTVVANSASRAYGAANPAFSGILTGVVSGDGITASYSSTASTSTPIGTAQITATLNDPNNRLSNYTVTNTPGVLTITSGELTVTASNAVIAYGQPLPTFIGTITGALGSDTFTESYAVTPTPASPPLVGTYTITPAANGSGLANYVVTTVSATLTVTQSVTSMSLQSNTTQVNSTQKPQLTATVTSSGPAVPTGQVTFTDNYIDSSNNSHSVVLSTIALNGSGVATLSNKTLTNSAGLHTITATYAGDTNNAPATAAPVTINLGAADFTISVSSPNLTVTRGQTATDTITITPINGYQASVNFQCGTLPSYVTCSFSPDPLAVGGTGPVGDNLPVTATVTISTDAVSSLGRRGDSTRLAGLRWLPALILCLLIFVRRRRLNAVLRMLAAMAVLGSMGLAISGCGASSTPPDASPLGSSATTITASASALVGSGSSDENHQISITINIVQ